MVEDSLPHAVKSKLVDNEASKQSAIILFFIIITFLRIFYIISFA